jgi:6-phosphogluconolactonase
MDAKPALPEITICDDLEEVSRRGAIEFAQTAKGSINKQGVFRVALSGGSTPMAMYRLLATVKFRERVDWTRVVVFFGDERCVPLDDDESNFKAADAALLNKVAIPEGNIHRIRAELGEAAAHEYE